MKPTTAVFAVATLVAAVAGRSEPRTQEGTHQLDTSSCTFQQACVCSTPAVPGIFDSIACYPNPHWPFFFDAYNRVDTTELFLGGNFSSIPKNAFDGLRKVQTLELQRSNFKGDELLVFDPDAFVPSMPNYLEQLMIFDANLGTLPNAVQTLSSLKFLQIQRSTLPSLPDYAFQAADQSVYSSPRLSYLILIQDGLQSLAPKSLAGQEATLQTLDLSRNRLSSFPKEAISPLGNLQQLTLDQNGMSTLPGAAFSRLTRLATLSLVGNALAAIPDDAFTGLEGSLRWLSLDGNALTRLPNSVFFLRALQTLKADSNRLRRLSAGTFRNLPLLSQLHLDYNVLDQLDTGVFSGLTQLRTLRLSHCEMGAVNLAFLADSSVTELHLTHNARLSALDLSAEDAARLPESLALLNVSANPKLAVLSPVLGQLLSNSSQLVLDLSGATGLQCGCSLLWMKPLASSARLRTDGARCSPTQTLRDFLAGLDAASCERKADSGAPASSAVASVLASVLLAFALR